MGIDDVLRLTRTHDRRPHARARRLRQAVRDGVPISVMEFLYPLLQGWDSVMVQADVELGGTDQLFNNLDGPPAPGAGGPGAAGVLTMPLLVGLDGVQKMSKSLGNYVGITEPPAEQFGKLMSHARRAHAALLHAHDRLAPRPGRRGHRRTSPTGALAPVDAKRLLARTVVDLYHGDGAGDGRRGRVRPGLQGPRGARRRARASIPPEDVRDGRIRVATLARAGVPGLVPSNKEGRRKIVQGGVRLDGEVVDRPRPRASRRPTSTASSSRSAGATGPGSARQRGLTRSARARAQPSTCDRPPMRHERRRRRSRTSRPCRGCRGSPCTARWSWCTA